MSGGALRQLASMTVVNVDAVGAKRVASLPLDARLLLAVDWLPNEQRVSLVLPLAIESWTEDHARWFCTLLRKPRHDQTESSPAIRRRSGPASLTMMVFFSSEFGFVVDHESRSSLQRSLARCMWQGPANASTSCRLTATGRRCMIRTAPMKARTSVLAMNPGVSSESSMSIGAGSTMTADSPPVPTMTFPYIPVAM